MKITIESGGQVHQLDANMDCLRTIKISNRVSTIFYNGYTLPEAMQDFLETTTRKFKLI